MINVLLSHKTAIIGTIVLMLINLMYQHSIINTLLILATAGLWLREIQPLKSNEQDAINMVKRVHKLKKFSSELQQLVNAELALVQEDVIRIRGVVSDSIGILQNATENIRQSTSIHIDEQSGEEITSADNDSSSNIRYICEHLENTVTQINTAKAVIHSIEQFSEQVNLLSTNLSIEALQAGSTQRAFDHANQSYQAISSQSHVLQESISTSSKEINSIITEVKKLSTLENTENAKLMIHQSMTSAVNDNLIDITRALQFEDIVCQISERVASHIGDIRFIVERLSQLHENELSTMFEENLQKTQEEMEEIKKKLSKDSAKAIVAQENMQEGDIELF